MAYKQELWQEAKKRCRLGDEEIRGEGDGIESEKPDQKCSRPKGKLEGAG